jgi:hypothetical protein
VEGGVVRGLKAIGACRIDVDVFPTELQVFLGNGFRCIAGGGLEGDAIGENAPEVGDAQQEDQEQRQDQSELDESLAAL